MGQATLSIQGTIQKSFGGAVDDGKYSLTFKLYTVESGGTAVWSETQNGIEVIGGVYSALLGAATPITASFNTAYYLGISVDGGQELTPRTRLTSAPLRLVAHRTEQYLPLQRDGGRRDGFAEYRQSTAREQFQQSC